MGQRLLRRSGLVALAAAAALLVGSGPAAAADMPNPQDTGGASAYGVQVHASLLGLHALDVDARPVAKVTGPRDADLAHLNVRNLVHAKVLHVQAHKGSSGQLDSKATVAQLTLPFLHELAKGPVAASAITASCMATADGVTGKASIADLKIGKLGNGGVMANPPANKSITVGLGNKLGLAKITFNEQIRHNDGSLTVNAVHIKLLNGVLANVAHADIILSSATCGPAVLPAPMASGLGLWIGLGLLVVVAVPTGIVVIRKRKASAQAAA